MTEPRITSGTGVRRARSSAASAHWPVGSMGTEPPQVFLVLGRTKRLFWGWLMFAGGLMPGGKLPRRETELIILRVATLAGSAYERAHHERIGKRAGVTKDDLAAVAVGPADPHWNDREVASCCPPSTSSTTRRTSAMPAGPPFASISTNDDRWSSCC